MRARRDRVAWFFAQAREALWTARHAPNPEVWIMLAMNYRQLAKETRARKSVRP